jgi:hypothetical protein
MEYVAAVAFLLSVVAGSFAAVIFGGYGIAQLMASALLACRQSRRMFLPAASAQTGRPTRSYLPSRAPASALTTVSETK